MGCLTWMALPARPCYALVSSSSRDQEDLMSHNTSTRQAWASRLTVFAAVMMMIAGGVQFYQGLVALGNSEFYVIGRDYTFKFDVTAWGWIHVLLGIGIAAVGVF